MCFFQNNVVYEAKKKGEYKKKPMQNSNISNQREKTVLFKYLLLALNFNFWHGSILAECVEYVCT